MSKDKLLSILNTPELIKNKPIKNIRKNSNSDKTPKDTKPLPESKSAKNKTIKDISRENYDVDKILRGIRTP